MRNKIKHSKVDILFASESGYSSKGGYSSKNSDAMIDAIDELTRILAIEGRGADAQRAVNEAVDRVKSDLSSRA